MSKRIKAWQHDKFTSTLPFAQAGADVTIPFGEFDDVDVNFSGNAISLARTSGGDIVDGQLYVSAADAMVDASNNSLYIDNATAETSTLEVPAPTINELRRAFAVQRWLEMNARGGRRYKETLEIHFDVKTSDSRLQRPELIGAETKSIVVSEVLQTSQSITQGDDPSALGDMGGHAISFSNGNNNSYFVEEHGFIISILCVMPDSGYYQGVEQMFWRKDRYQYPWPVFAHLGEEGIENREIYYEGTEGEMEEDHTVFGYLPRYADFRTAVGRVSGEFGQPLNSGNMTANSLHVHNSTKHLLHTQTINVSLQLIRKMDNTF